MREELLNSCTSTRQRGGKGLDRETCVKQLQDSIDLYPQTVIVLDGLDECEKGQRKMLFDVLDVIVALPKVKVFIASRPVEDLKSRFDWKKAFRLDTSDNFQDIKTYVAQRIADFEDSDDAGVPQETKDLVATTLVDEKASSRPM